MTCSHTVACLHGATPHLRSIEAGLSQVWLEQRGITVANNGGANAVGVSETVLALMYAVSRGFIANIANVKAGLWNRGPPPEYLGQLAGGGAQRAARTARVTSC